jgi:hypothetical protein
MKYHAGLDAGLFLVLGLGFSLDYSMDDRIPSRRRPQ